MDQLQDRMYGGFTLEYAQPDSYRYCMESVILAEWVATQVAAAARLDEDRVPLSILDVGTGCGVVLLEFAHRLKRLVEAQQSHSLRPKPILSALCGVERQSEFAPFFERNRLALRDGMARGLSKDTNWPQPEFVLTDIREWTSDKRSFDIIMANPPFFDPEDSLPSPDPIRESCRRLVNGSLSELIASSAARLSSCGRAYFLVRPRTEHGRDSVGELQYVLPELTMREVAKIRRSLVVEIQPKRPSITDQRHPA